MSQDYSNNQGTGDSHIKESNIRGKRNWWLLFILPAWVTLCFFVAQILVAIPIVVADKLGIGIVNESILNTLISALVYIITLLFVVVLPFKLKNIGGTTRSELGLARLPNWMDIVLAPAGFVIYIILSALLVLFATHVLPGFNINQSQDVGFEQLSQQFEYVLAFITLVVVAPIAEEVLFRGYLFGKLRKVVPIWLAVLVTSLLFGVVHGTWNVAIDTFALSIILCILREMTGSLWSSILLHMIKNGIAFYILFIYPTFLTTLVK